MFRVYDTEEKCWMHNNIFFTPMGDILVSKKRLFGSQKLSYVPSSRYVCHKYTGLSDKNYVRIFEGDIVECVETDIKFVGVVTYIEELAAYVALCYENKKYYSLGTKQCNFLKVLGNIIENQDLLSLKYNGDKSE